MGSKFQVPSFKLRFVLSGVRSGVMATRRTQTKDAPLSAEDGTKKRADDGSLLNGEEKVEGTESGRTSRRKRFVMSA